MVKRLAGLAAACLASGAALLSVAAMAADGASESDPYLWLEEIEGDGALDWVRAQNERSLTELEGDPRFQSQYKNKDQKKHCIWTFSRSEAHLKLPLLKRSVFFSEVAVYTCFIKTLL